MFTLVKKEPKLMSNQELVDEFDSLPNPTWSPRMNNRRKILKTEVLRRLNEPWRKKSEDMKIDR